MQRRPSRISLVAHAHPTGGHLPKSLPEAHREAWRFESFQEIDSNEPFLHQPLHPRYTFHVVSPGLTRPTGTAHRSTCLGNAVMSLWVITAFLKQVRFATRFRNQALTWAPVVTHSGLRTLIQTRFRLRFFRRHALTKDASLRSRTVSRICCS